MDDIERQKFNPESEDFEEGLRNQLDTEFNVVCALREVINCARRKDYTTYKQALALAETLAPEQYAPGKRLLLGARVSDEARYFREVAEAESNMRGESVSAFEVVQREISGLEGNLEFNPDADLMKKRLDRLEIVGRELRATRRTEGRSILGDVFRTKRALLVSGEGDGYMEYRLDRYRFLRIRMLHPDIPEHKLGADVIYEHLDWRNRTARLAMVQYKTWDRRSFHEGPRVKKQLEKLRSFGCAAGLCQDEPGAKPPYRLPFCTCFLRPTDRVQYPNSDLVSSSLHIPLCVVDNCWEDNARGGRSLRREAVNGQSISHELFEKLFNARMLGSREITWAELERLYRTIQIFDQDETVVIHAQEYLEEEITEEAATHDRDGE
jgi:hypothetical protein